MPTLVIDAREYHSNSEVCSILEDSFDLAHSKIVEFGDYVFNFIHEGKSYTVGIEACTVPDLLNKISSGRLSRQMSGCLETYDVTILLVEGQFKIVGDGQQVMRPSSKIKLPYRPIQAAVFSVQANGVIVEHCPEGKDNVARAISNIYDYYNKETHEFIGKKPLIYKQGTEVDRSVAALARLIPGIGLRMSEDSLNRFGSIKNIVNSTDIELMSIKGWGRAKANRFRGIINRNIHHDR